MIVILFGAIATLLLAPFLPMILLVGCVLGLLSAFVEIKLVQNVAPIRWINSKSSIWGFALSIGISMVLGMIFGLGGLIAGIAGLGSSALTEPYFAFKRKQRSDDKFATQVAEVQAAYGPVLKGIKFLFTVIFFIFLIPIRMHRFKNKVVASVTA